MFNPNQTVAVRGTNYTGDAVVVAAWNADGSPVEGSDTSAYRGARSGQPFPQVILRKRSGKHIHFNGDDIAAGKVVAPESNVEAAAAPSPAPSASPVAETAPATSNDAPTDNGGDKDDVEIFDEGDGGVTIIVNGGVAHIHIGR